MNQTVSKPKLPPLYSIIFDDNTKFIGGNWTETKWLEIPINKKIRTIFYNLPTNDHIVLSNYDQYYNHMEITEDFYGQNKKSPFKLNFCYIIGRKQNLYVSYRIAMYNDMLKNVELKLENDKVINCSSSDRHYIKTLNKIIEVAAITIKKTDKVVIYDYKRNRSDILKVIDKKVTLVKGKFKNGDVSTKVLTKDSDFIKGLNKNNWRPFIKD